jgi:glycosyltransferase involved in cell wall biosynthesis
MNYTSPEMFTTLESIVREDRFDAVHLDGIHVFAYDDFLREATGAPIVYDWHNIESEKMWRFAAQEKGLKAWYAALTARRLQQAETRILESAHGHLVCSARERDELARTAPDARIALIENGVDTAYFGSIAPTSGPRQRVVFVGQMSYHANADAAVEFVRDVWPGIVTRHPDWTLSLVGSNPTPAVLALRASANVEVTGTVPDVRPYYGDAMAAIVPLRVGGGTRLKILEAMAAGVPVVSTALGAEGLAVSPDENLLIAETAGEWLAALDSVSGDASLRERITAAAHFLVRERYDWGAIGQQLVDAYRLWLKTI